MPNLLKNQTNPMVLEATGYSVCRIKQDDGHQNKALTALLKRQEAVQDHWRVLKMQEDMDVYSHQHGVNLFRSQWECSADKKSLYNRTKWEMNKVYQIKQMELDERRNRLKALMDTDKEMWAREQHAPKLTPQAQHAAMAKRYDKIMTDKEMKRQKVVAEKKEQHFRTNCDELRTLLSRRIAELVASEGQKLAQIKTQEAKMSDMEDKLFAEAWLLDAKAKEEKETEEKRLIKKRNMQYGLAYRECGNKDSKKPMCDSKDTEVELMAEIRHLIELEKEWEIQQKLLKQERMKEGLDECLKEKMIRQSKEAQEDVMLDLYYLEQITKADDEKVRALEKKRETKKQQDQYLDYLRRQIKQEAKKEAEIDKLYHEASENRWDRYEADRQADKLKRQLMNEKTMNDCYDIIESNVARCRLVQQLKIQHDEAVLKDVETFKQECKAEREKIRGKNIENQRGLLDQIQDRKIKAEQLKAARESESNAIRSAQDEYEWKVQKAIADPKIENLHPYRTRRL